MREIKSCYKKVFRRENFNKSSIRINSLGYHITMKNNEVLSCYVTNFISGGRWSRHHKLEMIERVKP